MRPVTHLGALTPKPRAYKLATTASGPNTVASMSVRVDNPGGLDRQDNTCLFLGK